MVENKLENTLKTEEIELSQKVIECLSTGSSNIDKEYLNYLCHVKKMLKLDFKPNSKKFYLLQDLMKDYKND